MNGIFYDVVYKWMHLSAAHAALGQMTVWTAYIIRKELYILPGSCGCRSNDKSSQTRVKTRESYVYFAHGINLTVVGWKFLKSCQIGAIALVYCTEIHSDLWEKTGDLTEVSLCKEHVPN